MNKPSNTKPNFPARPPKPICLRARMATPFTLMFILAVLVPCLTITSVTAAQSDKSINLLHAPRSQKVLVLHSYHDMDWTRTVQEGIESVFDKSGIAVEMYVEYMDTMRHPPKDSFSYLEELYRKKYGRTSFDVILLSDDNALEFLLSRRDKLFPGVPIVFCGINDFREEQLHGQSGITGVNEDIEIQGTIELALRIKPNIKKFIVISDKTATGLANRKKFERTLSGISDKVPTFELLDDLTAADLQEHLRKLTPDSAVLLLTFQQDKDGQLFTRSEYYPFIVESCNVPVFTFWAQESFRHGVIGGVMVSGATQGERSAEYALRILEGEPASSLPFIMKSPNVPILDYRVLRKFNIPKTRIPPEVIIQNEPITLYYRYKTMIWAAAIFLLSLIAVNMILLVNIARRKRAEEALKEQEAMLLRVLETLPVGVWIIDAQGTIVKGNAASQRIWAGARYVGMEQYAEYKGWWADSGRRIEPHEWSASRAITKGETSLDEEIDIECFDGTHKTILDSAVPFFGADGRVSGAVVVNQDITERKRSGEEREKLQTQLIQAQKMESVGRLAGGVAHDFNNMLSVILGYTELALDKADISEPLHADLKEVYNAAKRSVEITRQLLAFARKQTISPRLLDLNETVEGMLKMLRRLIGEDIDLAWLPGSGTSLVMVDPSQIDQILANLCVNARDAISGVGKVTIETDNVTFDAAYCDDHPGSVPGDFVLLAVSDDGCGMDKETLDHVFEPFFTTKGLGQGTGLGLATVYGIVKQNNGLINVYSEVEKGTTCRIYLPRHAGEASLSEMRGGAEIPKGRGETVLIVEDDASILKLAKSMIEMLGYAVLDATTPARAVDLAQKHAGKIHLLLTDVVMPEMNGRDLAGQLQILYPDLKVLYMSGYTANVIAHRGVLESGVSFIQKPFSVRDLADKVRETLGQT